jgi:dephospho-CoA kinase
MALVVGLTGASAAASRRGQRLRRARIDVTDTDRLARPHRAGSRVTRCCWAFGPAFFRDDRTLDRAKLRAHVFGDAGARARLEAILHPLIRAAARQEVARWASPYGLLVVPLLFERGGHRDLVARVLVVDCPEDTQVRRVMERSGLTEAEVRAIMATQLPRAERLARADDVIDNGGALEGIPPQVAALDRRYRALAAEPVAAGRL